MSVIIQESVILDESKCSRFMKRIKMNKLLILAAISASIVFQSCAAGKGCGCGNDINKNYRTPKRYP